MKLLEDRIRKDGVVKAGNVLKVDSFLNHQMDVPFFNEMGKEFKRLFEGTPINKILTIEASGIGIAIIAGLHFQVPVVFAKKSRSSNISDQVYHTIIHSYTHNCDNDVVVSKQYLHADDHLLIIDDFLANGCALQGLIQIVQAAGATVEDIVLMRETVGPNIGVKAAGGARSYEDAEAFIEAGATRIGTSSGVAIVSGETVTEGY